MPTDAIANDVVIKAISIYRKSGNYLINRRMQFIYLKAKKYPIGMIADILLVTRKTIWEWNTIFQEGGLEALTNLHYKGQPSKLNPYGEQLVFEFLKNPVATLKEAQYQIEKLTHIKRSVVQVSAFLNRFKLKRRKVGQIPEKADIDKQNKFKNTKLKRLIKLAEGCRIKLFFIDAAHFVHQPFLGYLYGLKRLFIRSAAGRKRFNVLGALDAISKSVSTICNETYINATSVCQLFELLAQQYVGEKIYVILDNARYQKCPIVFETAKRLHIHLVYLPAYSPNLNLIERLWRFTKKKILYSKFYASFDEFKNAFNTYWHNLKNSEYESELNSLLTLSFQSFDMLQTNP